MRPATDSLTPAAEGFVRDMAKALETVRADEVRGTTFVDRLIADMRAGPLTRNHLRDAPIDPPAQWHDLSRSSGSGHSTRLLRRLRELEPAFRWMDGRRFWPKPEHRRFSRGLWGTFLVGDGEAPFSAEDRYIALLMIIGPRVLYPLHAHRIEELYFVLSGHGDWSHDGISWRTLSPGSIFFNPTWQPHAIRANRQPVLAIGFYLPPYGWEGGLVEKSG